MSAFYESDRALAEYLLFHYGTAEQIGPPTPELAGLLGFAQRCVTQGFVWPPSDRLARALDLGCAVGGAAFELARHVPEVIGIDYSRSFVAAAERLRGEGILSIEIIEEGELTRPVTLRRPEGIDPARLHFQTGDALNLPTDLGAFDLVLAANLIDRLADPARFLASLPALVSPGGSLLLTSPYTWLEEYTPRDRWLGGFIRAGQPVKTLDTLRELLAPAFTLEKRVDLPFLIREHARKFQASVAEGTLWRRKNG